MKLWTYFGFYLVALLLVGAAALFQASPGYMDADYYFLGGRQLATGFGFSDPIIWNYLDNPESLPHPANAYWMPLASIVAGLGQIILGKSTFWSGRFGFILIAALIPPLTLALTFRLTNKRKWAVLAGVLAFFPGFYLPYLGTTDTFALMMVLGGVFLVLFGYLPTWGAGEGAAIRSVPFILGILAGLMQLARADGALWLMCGGIGLILAWRAGKSNRSANSFRPLIFSLGLYFFGYLILMGPWMVRNLDVFGALLSPGGTKALWMTNYDELFSYPGGELSFTHWMDSGLVNIIRARLSALGSNLTHTVVVQGLIILAPLSVVGLWRLRRDLRVQVGLLAWLATFLAMTIVFPFPGVRGGLFHSGAAVQTLIWASVPVGLAALVDLGRKYRGWDPDQATKIFRPAVLVGVALLTVFVFMNRVIGTGFSQPVWDESSRHYDRVEAAINQEDASIDLPILVNNPAGYYVVAERPALAIPNEGVDALNQIAAQFGVGYLVLEQNHPASLNDLYEHPEDLEGLKYLRSVDTTHIFEIIEN